MKTSDFDYELPAQLVAQAPLKERDASKMLVIDPLEHTIQHSSVRRLPDFLDPQDVLILNDTRVFPSRLRGERAPGKEAEILLLRQRDKDGSEWEALVRPGRSLRAGAVVQFPGSRLQAQIGGPASERSRLVRFLDDSPLDEIRRIGEMPTPPYIHERLREPDRYQTVYAHREGSAAAPTAGLHFTPGLLEAIRSKGVQIAFVTLHVGLDTFAPVRVEDPKEHPIHSESYELSETAARAVMEAKERRGRVVAVGTTCVRVLETCWTADGMRSGSGETSLLIVPGFQFKAVDALLTNFHLPKSSLLMLVSAFAGREFILDAYRQAIRHEYRFFSFGDCMLITRRA
jgi:S-adenosylmethionine:tRNA ribosyltransferase-isomerase